MQRVVQHLQTVHRYSVPLFTRCSVRGKHDPGYSHHQGTHNFDHDQSDPRCRTWIAHAEQSVKDSTQVAQLN
jgi:isopenicillin N synthase-like dioxygenase